MYMYLMYIYTCVLEKYIYVYTYMYIFMCVITTHLVYPIYMYICECVCMCAWFLVPFFPFISLNVYTKKVCFPLTTTNCSCQIGHKLSSWESFKFLG